MNIQFTGEKSPRLSDDEKVKIRIEKRAIIEKYKWISGEFNSVLESKTCEFIKSFEDIFKLFANNDGFSLKTIGITVYGICVNSSFNKEWENYVKDESGKIKKFEDWNSEFVADMTRLVELRKLVPKSKKNGNSISGK
jgi:hypothetical protein